MNNHFKTLEAYNHLKAIGAELYNLSNSKYLFVILDHYADLRISAFHIELSVGEIYSMTFSLTEEGFILIEQDEYTDKEVQEVLEILNNWKEIQE